jgi:predicted ribosome quality control (RQC) complex YloA/Tae2 family protein
MDELTLETIAGEAQAALAGGIWGRVWQTGRAAFFCEIRKEGAPFLFLCADPAAPRLYPAPRRVRDVERNMLAPQGFALTLRRRLAGLTLVAVTKDAGERVVRLAFTGRDELGAQVSRALVAQLTGRAANLLLLDERGHVMDALRRLRGAGQEIGDLYAPPAPLAKTAKPKPPAFTRGDFATLSAAADHFYSQLEAARTRAAQIAAARQKLQSEIARREKLVAQLQREAARHGPPDAHKRLGELLLANLSTAERRGGAVSLIDFFAPDAPRIEVAIDERDTLQEAAARCFARYGKAKRAALEIARRTEQLNRELADLHARRDELEQSIAAGGDEFLSAADAPQEQGKGKPAEKQEAVPGARRYVSADGYEILVGRAAKDNDHLTFRVARPHDWWLHAADYPGSHVVVRNPARGELPHRTLREAAQLAAYFSQANKLDKADVRYTQRKFVAKPKGGAPGLVRLAQFKTIVVAPSEI